MTGRTLFSHSAAAELKEQAAAPAEPVGGQWEVIGRVPAHDGGPERRLLLSADRFYFAIGIEIYGAWQIKAGPWSYETMLRCAENIVAGDKRAITWPDAQLCLAAGYLAIFCEGERARKAQQPASAERTVAAAEEQPATAGTGNSLASEDLPVSPPPSPRCVGECGQ